MQQRPGINDASQI